MDTKSLCMVTSYEQGQCPVGFDSKAERCIRIVQVHSLGYTLKEIADSLKIHYTTVSKIVNKYSERTDNSRPDNHIKGTSLSWSVEYSSDILKRKRPNFHKEVPNEIICRNRFTFKQQLPGNH